MTAPAAPAPCPRSSPWPPRAPSAPLEAAPHIRREGGDGGGRIAVRPSMSFRMSTVTKSASSAGGDSVASPSRTATSRSSARCASSPTRTQPTTYAAPLIVCIERTAGPGPRRHHPLERQQRCGHRLQVLGRLGQEIRRDVGVRAKNSASSRRTGSSWTRPGSASAVSLRDIGSGSGAAAAKMGAPAAGASSARLRSARRVERPSASKGVTPSNRFELVRDGGRRRGESRGATPRLSAGG